MFCDECGATLLQATRSIGKQALESPSPQLAVAPLKLVLNTLDNQKQFECELTTELLIGRADPSVKSHPDIDLDELKGMQQGVSRKHARLLRVGEKVLLEDLNSLNGTYVRGLRLPANSPQIIQSGDQLQFGKVILKISF
jgi:pSer/pThr/pTyr-binding forkhead associated (FHA) protein